MDRQPGTGSPGNRASVRRSIHSRVRPKPPGHKYEVRFLRYRLEVVRSWPESERKRVLMEAIEGRLAAEPQPPE